MDVFNDYKNIVTIPPVFQAPCMQSAFITSKAGYKSINASTASHVNKRSTQYTMVLAAKIIMSF